MDMEIAMGLPEEMVQAYQEAQRIPLPLGIGTALLCFAVGIVCLLWPDLMWELQHRWSVQDGTPTDLYRISTRILGGAILTAGALCVVLTVRSWL